MESKNINSFWRILERIIWLLLIYLVIQWYFKAWINAFKEGKYIKFGLMSILPLIIIYYIQHQMLYGHPPRFLNDPDIMYDNCTCKWTLMDVFI